MKLPYPALAKYRNQQGKNYTHLESISWIVNSAASMTIRYKYIGSTSWHLPSVGRRGVWACHNPPGRLYPTTQGWSVDHPPRELILMQNKYSLSKKFAFNYCIKMWSQLKPLISRPVPEFIDPVFANTSPKRTFSLNENERFELFFAKSGSIISRLIEELQLLKENGYGIYSLWCLNC
jgi:hypothetical protein